MGSRLVMVAVLALGAPSSAFAQEDAPDEKRWFVDAQLHSTFLAALLDAEPLQMSAGVSTRVARRDATLGWYLSADTTWWGNTELDHDSEDVFDGTPQGIVAVTLGIEHLYFRRRMRFMADAGVTFMLRETRLDMRGRAGIAGSLRPVGIRIPMARRRAFVIDPLSLTILIPDIQGIPLVLFQFRTVLTIEIGVGGDR